MATAHLFFSGIEASVSVNGTTRYGQKWEMEVEAGEIDVTNFESPTAADGSKWREYLGGFTRGNITIDCIDDPTQAQPQRGAATSYSLGVGGGHSISGSAVYVKERRFTDIEGVAKRSYTLRMTGAPTVA